MDDGEIDELWEQQNLFEENGTCGELPSIPATSTCSMDSFFDEVFESAQTSCTHTHTCNPPTGPDNTHTHTCYHTHTSQLLATGDEKDESAGHKSGIIDIPPGGGGGGAAGNLNKKCPLGNKVAVRKYREKKKAHTALLEEQVNQLIARNQQLTKRLQEQACLEAEVLRLQSLLAEFRGRIDAEIGGFPAQKPCLNNNNNTPPTVALSEDCNVQPFSGASCVGGGTMNIPCATDLPCLHAAPASGSSSTAKGAGF